MNIGGRHPRHHRAAAVPASLAPGCDILTDFEPLAPARRCQEVRGCVPMQFTLSRAADRFCSGGRNNRPAGTVGVHAV